MSGRWRIVIGSDAAGLIYKDALKTDLEADPRVAKVSRCRCPDRSAQAIRARGHRRSAAGDRRPGRPCAIDLRAGLGVAISANTVPGIRAVTASDSSAVERSVLDNDAQVLCFGHQDISLDLARRLAQEWLGYRFDPTRTSHTTLLASVDRVFQREVAVIRRSWWTSGVGGVPAAELWPTASATTTVMIGTTKPVQTSIGRRRSP